MTLIRHFVLPFSLLDEIEISFGRLLIKYLVLVAKVGNI